MTDLMTSSVPETRGESLEVLSREATAKAFEKHLVARGNYAGSWEALADLFAEDATYLDVFYGEMKGREAIRTFLRKSMEGIQDWSFPVQWTLLGEGRVVVHWMNRLPGKRPGGTFYEFPGVSCITYGSDGKITRQVDLYDGLAAIKVIIEAKGGIFGSFIRALARRLGAIGRECIRTAYRLREAARR
jgi:hypothetical protein